MLEEPPQDATNPEAVNDDQPVVPSPPQPMLLPPGRYPHEPPVDEVAAPSSLRPAEGAELAAPDFVWSDARQQVTYPPWAGEEPQAAAEKRTRFGIRVGRLARDLIETVILALLIFVGVRAMVQNFRVEGSSMEGTLHDGQYILVNKALYFKVDLSFLNFLPFFDAGSNPVHYVFRAPRRGDVVVFRFPNQTDRDFIKRIIGEPGDTVQIKEGLVYINGHALQENYILEQPTHDFGPEVVPAGQYFVLGDNRNNSYDSRSWGFVDEKYIVGRAWVSYWPFSNFGLVSDPHVEPLGAQQGASP